MDQPTSYTEYAKQQEALGCQPTPRAWWDEWSSEQDRAFLASRLQQSDVRYVRVYGLTLNWQRIPERVQRMLIQI